MAPVIDVHAHFLPKGVIEARATGGGHWHGTQIELGPRSNPTFRTGKVTTSVYLPAFWQRPHERVQRMDELGVGTQLVSIAPPLFRYFIDADDAIAAARETNDELHEWTQEWSGRFLGFATLPLQSPAAAVAELERAVRDLHLVGAAVGTHVDGRNWDDASLLPVLQAAEELGAILLFHPAEMRGRDALQRYQFPNIIGNPFETTTAIGSLIFGGVLDRVPDLKMIFVHGGGFACANVGRFDHGYSSRKGSGFQARRLPSEYLRELYFDCIVHDARALRCIADVAGLSQIVLGTDYPADMGIQDPVGWVGALEGFSGEEREAILGRNAERLLLDAPLAAEALNAHHSNELRLPRRK